MKVRAIISGITLAAIGFGSEVSADTPNVSFGFGPDGVTFNLSTYPYYYYDGMYPPPPPPCHHRQHHRGFMPSYGVPMSPKQYKKAVKKYMKQQEKYAKKYYKHQRKHHRHHHDDDD